MVKKARKLLTLPSVNTKVQKWLLFGFSLLLFSPTLIFQGPPSAIYGGGLDPEEEEESPIVVCLPFPDITTHRGWGEGAGFIFPPSLERGERSLLVLVLVLSGEEYRR